LLSVHADKLTDDGHQRLVRHGHLPEREIMTGIGPAAVRCTRVRDRAVFWLMSNSNLVGNSAGSSAGLAPRRTLAMRAAPCRQFFTGSTP
jgi:hypothetical protein